MAVSWGSPGKGQTYRTGGSAPASRRPFRGRWTNPGAPAVTFGARPLPGRPGSNEEPMEVDPPMEDNLMEVDPPPSEHAGHHPITVRWVYLHVLDVIIPFHQPPLLERCLICPQSTKGKLLVHFLWRPGTTGFCGSATGVLGLGSPFC